MTSEKARPETPGVFSEREAPEGPNAGGQFPVRFGILADIAGFVGAVLIVFAAIWLRMRPGETVTAYWVGGIGGLLFVFYAGYYVLRWLKDPRWAELTQIALYSLVVLAIIVGLNFVAYRNKKEWDLTEEKIHTLAPESLNAVRQISEETRIVLFIQEADPRRERLQTLVRRYADANPRVTVEIVDPIRDPLKAIAYGLQGQETAAYVEQGTRRVLSSTVDEQGITNAILKILKPPRTVCFTSGHKEKDPKDASEEGLSDIARYFSDKNYQVRTISLLQTGKVSDECAVLVIAGPKSPFLEPEIRTLEAYAGKDEARLLIAIDPLTKPGLDDLLKKWGISVKTDLFIVDPQLNRGNPTFIVLGGAGIGFSKESEITRMFGDEGMVFPLATPILIGSPPQGNPKVTAILKSMPSSWAQSDVNLLRYQPARGDLKGPQPVGVSIEDGNKRFIVLGDSDFASNVVVQTLVNNRDLALNMVRWLVKEEELISLTKKETRSEVLTLSRSAGQFIFVYSLLLLPGVFAGFGILVWLGRRGK